MRRFLPDTFTLLLVATVVFASFLPARGVIADWLDVLVDIMIGLVFFLHGARLSRDVVIAGFLHWRLHLAILGTTFVLFPVIGLALGLVPESLLPRSLYLGLLYLCLLPSTIQSSIAFTSMAGGNVPAAVCAASASNIFGMFLTPFLVGLLFSAGGHGSFSFDALQQILLQLFAPFVLGQVLQPWIGNWVRARKALLTPIDRGSILLVVYLAFGKAVLEGIWSNYTVADLAVVVGLDMLILALVLTATMFGSRKLGFSKPDEITITFCGSKKSLASGVPMANVIFAGQPIGAILLPLMLFHQIQLMACAVIAQGYARKAQRAAAANGAVEPAKVAA